MYCACVAVHVRLRATQHHAASLNCAANCVAHCSFSCVNAAQCPCSYTPVWLWHVLTGVAGQRIQYPTLPPQPVQHLLTKCVATAAGLSHGTPTAGAWHACHETTGSAPQPPNNRYGTLILLQMRGWKQQQIPASRHCFSADTVLMSAKQVSTSDILLLGHT